MNESPGSDVRLVVYVDGFNLYHGLHSKWRRKYLWLDVVKLVEKLREQQTVVKVRYFTASVLNDPQGQANQAHYLNALQAKYPEVFELVLGRYQGREKECKFCGETYTLYEEKETDVNIATSIVVDALSGDFDAALIISADSDVAPAVVAARKANPDYSISAAFPPKRYSKHLKALMAASFPIGDAKIRQSQLDDSFEVNSAVFTRPPKWN